MPSGMYAGLAQQSTRLDWVDDRHSRVPAARPAERVADVYCVRRWCETPAEAPVRMEARAFEPISPRHVLCAVFQRAGAPAASASVRTATGAGSRA